jgi:hypothetical protein
MTAFCSHQDSLHELAGVSRSPSAYSPRQTYVKRLGVLVHNAIDAIAAFGSRADGSLQPAGQADSDTARFPQRPLILGDKWDF